MKLNIKSILQFCQLSLALAKVNFKTKTEGSYLGLLWHILNPLLYFFILFFIFNSLTGKEIENYPAYLLSGIIMFRFFQAATSEATTSILSSESAIRSLHFNFYSIPLSVVLTNLFNHLIELVIIVGFLSYFQTFSWAILIYPIILFLLTIFIAGVALFLSALAVLFMDTVNLWNNFVRLLWFATPIFYAVEINSTLEVINKTLNPMFYFIEMLRVIIIKQTIPSFDLLIPATLFTAVSFGLGILTFQLTKPRFSENL